MRKDKKSFIEGFTIIELLISVSIIAVLASMILALNGTIRNKAEQAACVANMRSLFTALSAYNNDNGHFPQAPNSKDEESIWDFWFTTFEDEYDIPRKTWICPTYRRLNKTKDEEELKGTYVPTRFSASSALAAYRWGNQPWLVEIGDHHGKGMLVLFPDGSVRPFSVGFFEKE